jgi:hypothetical protein
MFLPKPIIIMEKTDLVIGSGRNGKDAVPAVCSETRHEKHLSLSAWNTWGLKNVVATFILHDMTPNITAGASNFSWHGHGHRQRELSRAGVSGCSRGLPAFFTEVGEEIWQPSGMRVEQMAQEPQVPSLMLLQLPQLIYS